MSRRVFSWILFLGALQGRLCLAKPEREPLGLPKTPEGVVARSLSEFEESDQEPTRLAIQPKTGRIYVLGGGGDVTVVDPKNGAKRRVLAGADYIEQPKRQNRDIPLPVDAKVVNAPITLRATLALGLTFDRAGRLYIVVNVQIPSKIFINRVDIYRVGEFGADGVPKQKPKLWTRFDYPYGVGGFNHGACRIAQGPDGLIYLGSGSRTDHGEAGEDASLSALGEAPHPDIPGGADFPAGDFTASILRFDPEKGNQAPEVYSRGNRNPFGFDWDDAGRLIDAEHGPMADHPEELNWIRQGKHYGFPYVFGKDETPAYKDRVAPPPGLEFEAPIENLGPAGILGVNSMYSLSPHAAPGGLVYYREGTLPEKFAGSFFLARFGNLVNYNRIGFDVLSIRLEETDGRLVARVERFLDDLARPIDLAVGEGKLYVLEYCRQTETTGPASAGYNDPGRILEIRGK